MAWIICFSLYTRHLSSCLFVGCIRSPRSHSLLCSRGFVPLPPRCILKSIGYMQQLTSKQESKKHLSVALYTKRYSTCIFFFYSFCVFFQHVTLRNTLINMAGVPGFEPGNAGIRIRCLTAWRYPNKWWLRRESNL